ncbi:MAG: class I SAM-dependent methyltransferase [Candidatus Falkowbacteria bacterium]|nr:MAG: class I SAM-dependent methyltransferase [Candidatus Falkowbacteria bacterium]
MLYQEISECRICGNKNLISILDLGEQHLTGIFPKPEDEVERGPLEIVKCVSTSGEDVCGLLQLKHDYQMEKLYGDNYGYRSGLNKSMVEHLGEIVKKIENRLALADGDLIIDIASNDGTLLSKYANKNLDLLGIDPTSKKFQEYYPAHVNSVADFFSKDIVRQKRNGKKAKAITSIAMFYDLPKPLEVMKEIAEVMDDEGIWVVEQSYMPEMINNTSYDTICHEHLEFYSLKQFKWMADRAGLKIIDIEMNRINGASFALTLAKKSSSYEEATEKIKQILELEETAGFNDLNAYLSFKEKTEKHKLELIDLIKKLKAENKKILGYGASTKGNVVLQYCGFTTADIPAIADVNEYKFGRQTPGTNIPIVSEAEAKKSGVDYFLVLPWHFKDNIIEREKEFLANGGKLIFPLPNIEIIGL